MVQTFFDGKMELSMIDFYTWNGILILTMNTHHNNLFYYQECKISFSK